MNVILTYQGHFQDGRRFVPDGHMVKIPTNRRVIVNVLEDVVCDVETAINQRVDALDKILAEALEAEHELSDSDWNEFESLRSQSNFVREINL